MADGPPKEVPRAPAAVAKARARAFGKPLTREETRAIHSLRICPRCHSTRGTIDTGGKSVCTTQFCKGKPEKVHLLRVPENMSPRESLRVLTAYAETKEYPDG